MPPSSSEHELRLDTAVVLSAATGHEKGGDFHLLTRVGSRTVAVVGDVEGHGASVAPRAAHVLEILDSVLGDGRDPAEILERLNRVLHDDAGFELFVTACAVTIDHAERSAAWAFAGHLPPHWLDTGLPIDGATPGRMLGVEPSCQSTSAEKRPLKPGEGMVLFTDGVEDVQARRATASGPHGSRTCSRRTCAARPRTASRTASSRRCATSAAGATATTSASSCCASCADPAPARRARVSGPQPAVYRSRGRSATVRAVFAVHVINQPRRVGG